MKDEITPETTRSSIGKLRKEASKEKKPIRELKEYHAEGYHYRLLKRNGDIAIFEQLTITGKLVANEVILIQRNKKRELPPDTEDWGKLGWSYVLRENAEECYRNLCRNRLIQ